MAKFKYAVDLMLEFDAEKQPLKKEIRAFVEEGIEIAEAGLVSLTKIRVRSVDLD